MKLRDYVKNAEEKNDPIAQLYISFKMQYGDKIEKNEQDARRWLTRSANQGNMVAISRKYYLGWDKKEDFGKSYEILIEYLKEPRSVEEEMIGYHMIAYMLRNGKGVEKNVEESVKYYEKSIKRGNYISNFNLGLIYLDGDENILKNIKKAIDLFELSIEQDIDIAQYYLAYIYYKGQKVERDLEKAKILFKKAVKKNNENAMFYLGLMYYKGEGVQKKLEKATSLFRRSSELKNFYSMNILGKMYEMGIGVEKNIGKAIELWENSANLGSDFALNKLGNYYLKAKNGVERNVNRALHLYQTAMEVGNVNSMNHLARIYKEGKYVPVNLELAASLYFKSANKDSTKGKQNFKSLVPSIEWKTSYHIYWPTSPLLDSQLVTLLLLSKTRMTLRSTKDKFSLNFLVKGIVMNIIKFLCHLEVSSSSSSSDNRI